jgi:LPPG:FO 2-phospho-L-lactate transferase
MREAIAGSPAPVVAVSPFVGGRVLKGPTEVFCDFAGIESGAAGVARAYGDLVDGVVADEPVDGIASLVEDTVMSSPESRRRVASRTLEFALSLYSRG